MKQIFIILFSSLILFACDSNSEYFDYRNKGRPATLGDMIGLWDAGLGLNGNTRTSYNYFSITQDSVLTRYYRQNDGNCYFRNEFAITDLENGSYMFGDDFVEVFVYKNQLGFYDDSLIEHVRHVYYKTDLLESSFAPLCSE